MSVKEEFKSFVKSNPSLANYVNNNEMTWQKFYEMYDLYGDDNEVWDKYLNRNIKESTVGISKINELFKTVDVNSIKEHISTAQKALDFVQELTSKDTPSIPKVPVGERPINKFFED